MFNLIRSARSRALVRDKTKFSISFTKLVSEAARRIHRIFAAREFFCDRERRAFEISASELRSRSVSDLF